MKYAFETNFIRKMCEDINKNISSAMTQIHENQVLSTEEIGKILPAYHVRVSSVDYSCSYNCYTVKTDSEVYQEIPVDYSKALMATFILSIVFYSNNIDSLIETVDGMQAFMEEACKCYVIDDSQTKERIVYSFKHKDNVRNEFRRDKGDKFFAIAMNYTVGPIPICYQDYSANQIEFDVEVQRELLNRYHAICNIRKDAQNQSIFNDVEQRTINQIKGFVSNTNPETLWELRNLMLEKDCSVTDAVKHMQNGVYSTKKKEKLRKQELEKLEEAKRRVDERKRKRSIKITELQHQRDDRIKRLEAEITELETRKREERKEHLQKIYQSTGDKWVNTLLDKVVHFLNTKVNVPVYAGVDYMRFHQERVEKRLPKTCVLLKPHISFKTESPRYGTVNYFNQSVPSFFDFQGDQLAYPMKFSIGFFIYTLEGKEVQEQILSQIKEAFRDVVELYVADWRYADRLVRFGVRIPENAKRYLARVKREIPEGESFPSYYIESEDTEFEKHCIMVHSSDYFMVYYPSDIPTEMLRYDSACQLNYLKQMQFCLAMEPLIKEGIKVIDKKYRLLMSNEMIGIIDGWLNYSQEFKCLKNMITYGRNRGELREMFENEFSTVVTIFPELVIRFSQGCSADSIIAEMEHVLDIQRKRVTFLSRELFSKEISSSRVDILIKKMHYYSQNIVTEDEPDERNPIREKIQEEKAIDFTKEKWYQIEKNEDDSILELAKPSWIKERERRAEEKRREEAQIQQWEDEQRYQRYSAEQYNCQSGNVRIEENHCETRSSHDSSGNSILANVISTAIGTAIGNHASKPKESKYKDYKGTAGCALTKNRFGCLWTCHLYDDCIYGRGSR